MNYFQFTYNNLMGYDPKIIHQIISKNTSIDNWWHYLPNVYIIRTTSSAKVLTDSIRKHYPLLKFLIIKVDINDFNGYLDKKAWEWFRKYNKKTLMYLKTNSSPTDPPDLLTFSSLKRALEENKDKY